MFILGPYININVILSASEWEFWGRGVVCVIAQAWGQMAAASCVVGEATRRECVTWRRSATAGSYGAVMSSATHADTRRRNMSVTRREWISVQSGHRDSTNYPQGRVDGCTVGCKTQNSGPEETKDGQKQKRMSVQICFKHAVLENLSRRSEKCVWSHGSSQAKSCMRQSADELACLSY